MASHALGWDDDGLSPLDLRPEPLDQQLETIAREEGVVPPAAPPNPAPPAPPAATPDVPVVVQLTDGSTVTYVKGKKGWEATLQAAGEGIRPEVFFGATKEELMHNVMVAKLNATQKIRSLNRKIKLGDPESGHAPAPVPATPAPKLRTLSADEVFEIKTQLSSDPDLAMQTWFQKKTGLTVEQLVQLAQQGADARNELDLEAVAKEFVAETPEYYATGKNYGTLIARLAKSKLGITLTKENFEATCSLIAQRGFWTVAHLQEAFEDLSEAGLLETAPPEEPEAVVPPAEPPAPPAPAATPTPEPTRIVRETRRPRAGLGIRAAETTAGGPAAPANQPPSAEALDNESDEAINALMAGVRQARRSGRA